jgi:hypothetical protein
MSRTTGKSSGKVFPANAAMAALLAQEEQDKALHSSHAMHKELIARTGAVLYGYRLP